MAQRNHRPKLDRKPPHVITLMRDTRHAERAITCAACGAWTAEGPLCGACDDTMADAVAFVRSLRTTLDGADDAERM